MCMTADFFLSVRRNLKMEFKCPENKIQIEFYKIFIILNQNQNITFVLSSYAKNGVLGGRFMVFDDLWLFLYPGFALFLA